MRAMMKSLKDGVIIVIDGCRDECEIVYSMKEANDRVIEMISEGANISDLYILEGVPSKIKVNVEIIKEV